MARITRITGGTLLIGLGVVGLVVPVMPGWLFIIPGLSLWAGEFAWARRLRDGARERFLGTTGTDRVNHRRTNRAA